MHTMSAVSFFTHNKNTIKTIIKLKTISNDVYIYIYKSFKLSWIDWNVYMYTYADIHIQM